MYVIHPFDLQLFANKEIVVHFLFNNGYRQMLRLEKQKKLNEAVFQ